MLITAIDPGPQQSAMIDYDTEQDGGRVVSACIESNEDMAYRCEYLVASDILAIEKVACYGMPVGEEVFDTCVWSGRFVQAASLQCKVRWVYRREVKLFLCHSARAKDANVRQALIDRFGPGRSEAVGTKKSPGPLYGVKSHLWAALGVAVTVAADMGAYRPDRSSGT